MTKYDPEIWNVLYDCKLNISIVFDCLLYKTSEYVNLHSGKFQLTFFDEETRLTAVTPLFIALL